MLQTPLKCMGGNKGTSHKWAINTISEHEETNEPYAPPQPDLDIKAYKEEHDNSKTMIKSMSKSSGSCTLSMRGRSSLKKQVS